MVKVGKIYELLDFLGKEQMVLFHPSDKLERHVFLLGKAFLNKYYKGKNYFI